MDDLIAAAASVSGATPVLELSMDERADAASVSHPSSSWSPSNFKFSLRALLTRRPSSRGPTNSTSTSTQISYSSPISPTSPTSPSSPSTASRSSRGRAAKTRGTPSSPKRAPSRSSRSRSRVPNSCIPRLTRSFKLSICFSFSLFLAVYYKLWTGKPRAPLICNLFHVGCPIWPVDGHVKPGYETVMEAFSENFEAGWEVGAGFTAYVGTEKVVDIWGGYHDRNWRRLYTPETLQVVFSSSKVVEGLVIAHLVDRGLLNYTERISTYWPEFGVKKKENVTLSDLLGHRAGVTYLKRPPSASDISDLDVMSDLLASQPHNFEGQRVQGYAGITRGWYLNEIIRRVHPKGRTIGQILLHEIMPLLDLEFYVGLPEDLEPRVCPLADPMKVPGFIRLVTPNFLQDHPPTPVMRNMLMNPLSIAHKALRASAPQDFPRMPFFPLSYNRRELWYSEGSSFGGISNARSLGRFAALLLNRGELEGVRLISEETADAAMQPLDRLWDVVVGRNVTFTRGGFGHGVRFPCCMDVEWVGWGGAGGSLVYWNQELNISFSYVPNSMGFTTMGMAGNLFRSEEMSLVQVGIALSYDYAAARVRGVFINANDCLQLYIPLEIGQQTVAELGEQGLIEFRDLNDDSNAFQRTYVNEIRRLDEMERKLSESECGGARFGIQIVAPRTQAEREDLQLKPSTAISGRTRSHQDIDEMEERLSTHESRIQQLNASQETLNRGYLELMELSHLLEEINFFFRSPETRYEENFNGAFDEDTGLLEANRRETEAEASEEGRAGNAAKLGFIAGVIARARIGPFERILFRALRGNLYMKHTELEQSIRDPVTGELVRKDVFIIFAHGKEILSKIRKISASLGATIYAVDEREEKRTADAEDVRMRLADLRSILDRTQHERRAELVLAAELLETWSTVIRKEKAVYFTMNLFSYDQGRRALIAEGWCPTSAQGAIRLALRDVTDRTSSTIPPILSEIPTTRTPPTFQKTNKFSAAFQEIVDSYGIASYREVNPGLYTVITFPFFFAVMFGDFGHGILVTAFAAWMCMNETKLLTKKWGEIWMMFFGGRYIILLMGIFSIYTGFLYNDIFSKATNFFGSGFEFALDNSTKRYVGHKVYTYPVGLDPAWHGSENALIFTNSYKMKMSIVFGVMHMLFGISLNVVNHIYFKRPMSIIAETVPQILYLASIFGYLVLMIIYKWTVNWTNPSEAPGLLNTLIYMFLSPGHVTEPLYPGQATVQSLLLIIALVCVPWMLLMKPYLLYQEHMKHRNAGYSTLPHLTRDSSVEMEPAHDLHDEHFDFSEIMIHQAIHTIEFCLSGISNTASYLRLWALSLAHAPESNPKSTTELSEVVWEFFMQYPLEMATGPFGGVILVIAFSLWFQFTVYILILMEGLSAFLHSLRLHWVEFQSKFYEGSGKKFEPFSFERLLADDSVE
ncbi:H(+)-transporting V0 sector ATPase subunit a [Irineochytrium annulatum]|nr:H(+)-transporting V0 sector ATPase subunit a [Irineochytrium annulatum]